MRKQILLMCDDFSFCRRFQETMQDDTTTIQYFLTVADALDSYTRQRYCLVIMDSCLENVDSQKLLQMMHRAKPVPILVLTDGKPVEDEIKFFSLGATVCVPKPVELRHFIAQSRTLVQFYMVSEYSEKRCYTLSFGMEHRGAPKRRTLSIRWIFCPIAYPSSAYAAGTWRKIVSSRPNGTAACRQKVVAPSGIFCPALRNPVGKIRRTYSLFGICAPVRMTSWTCRYSVIPSCPAHLLILLFGNKAF